MKNRESQKNVRFLRFAREFDHSSHERFADYILIDTSSHTVSLLQQRLLSVLSALSVYTLNNHALVYLPTHTASTAQLHLERIMAKASSDEKVGHQNPSFVPGSEECLIAIPEHSVKPSTGSRLQRKRLKRLYSCVRSWCNYLEVIFTIIGTLILVAYLLFVLAVFIFMKMKWFQSEIESNCTIPVGARRSGACAFWTVDYKKLVDILLWNSRVSDY